MALVQNPFRVRRYFRPDYYNIDKTLNSSQSHDDFEDLTSSTFRVFSNDIILEHIFSYLYKIDFKCSRAVCRRWKDAGELLFKKRFQIRFDFQEDPVEASQYEAPRNPSTFFQDYQDDFPLQALRLGKKLPWCESTLTQLFSTVGNFITDLTFSHAFLPVGNENEMHSYLEHYDLTALLGEIQNLKRLKIKKRFGSYRAVDFTRFSVSLRILQPIEYIHLEDCVIELSDDVIVVLKPKELHLKEVTFSLHKEPIENILLNEIVDFGVLTKLHVSLGICWRISERKCTNVKLDLAGTVAIKLLYLNNVEVLNFENLSWNVNSLDIFFIPLESKIKMTVKNFSISYAKCSLTLLPRNVKNLRLNNRVEFLEHNIAGFNVPWEFTLPNIKSLTLVGNVLPKIFPQLNVCFNNLTELILFSFERISIDVDMIPKSVKAVGLWHHLIQFVGNGVCEMDTFIMEWTDDLAYVEHCLNYFAPKNSFTLSPRRVDWEIEKVCLGFLFDLSIPNVSILDIPAFVFTWLIDNYMFNTIVKNHRKGHVVNSKGSKISFSFL